MKKTSLIFVCVLLSVFCFSSVSYCDSALDDATLILYVSECNLYHDESISNTNDFLDVMQTTKNFDEIEIFQRMWFIGELLLWSHDAILLFTVTYKEFGHDSNETRINRIIRIQTNIKKNLKYINEMYSFVKVVSLLHIIDKQRKITRSSLETLDKTIEFMRKLDKKQKKTKLK